MIQSSANIFDNGVARFFEPLAKCIGLPLSKPEDGVYEITGEKYALRIRRGIGHHRDFLVCLTPKDSALERFYQVGSEIGLALVAEFYGDKLTNHALHTDEGYYEAFAETAKVSGKYCAPILLNLRSDFEGIRRFVDKKIEDAGIKTQKNHFPPNVSEQW